MKMQHELVARAISPADIGLLCVMDMKAQHGSLHIDDIYALSLLSKECVDSKLRRYVQIGVLTRDGDMFTFTDFHEDVYDLR